MIWFDYLVLGSLTYFTIRGFLSGFVRVIFSFIGMIVAFLYSGWLSLKLAPHIGNLITNNPKILPILSYIISFLLIYLAFVIAGFIIVHLLGKFNLTLADHILGGVLGAIKGILFITILYLALVLPYPPSQEFLKKAKTYPLIKNTLKFTWNLIPQNWKTFLKEKEIKIF